MDTIIFIAMLVIFLILLWTEYFLLKKYYGDGIKELKMYYEDIVETTKKETERKVREECFKEPIEIKHTIIDTNQYEQSIIMDTADIQTFEGHPEDLQNLIRSSFADKFAKEVIKPNLVIHEVVDIESFNKKKYFAKIHIGF
jgi:hypothetical protein